MKKYEIVSLGLNCLPRTVLTRGGVKPRKADGELSCPFDLVAHPIETILKCLETNFEGYFDDLYFKLRKRNFLDFRKQGIWQKKDGTKFFHDKDCKQNDMEKLVNRIKNRIYNFNSIIAINKPVIFVMAVYSETNCIDKIFKELKRLRGDKPFKLLILDYGNNLNLQNKEIDVLKILLPDEKFIKIWNKTGYVKSKLGCYIEKMVCNFVKSNAEMMLKQED